MYMEGQARYEIIAKEKHDALDPALQNCKDKLCRIKAGQALNAHLILYSKITSSGEDQYSVNVEIIDMAKKSAIISFDEKWNGDSESIDPLSEKIARRIAAKQANLDALNSTPTGATVSPDQSENFKQIGKDFALCSAARKKGNVKSWNNYLKKFPEGECKEEAKKALDNIACEAARKESNEKEWNKYLKDFPKGQCLEEAKAFFAGESSKKDKAACETARKKSNEKEWNQYLKDFPKGQCVEEAKAFFAEESSRKDKAACETARKRSYEKDWNQYLKDFPEGQCAEEAKAFLADEPLRREKTACEKARNRSNEKEWNQYLKDFPEGECVEEAKTFLAEEPLRREKAACETARKRSNEKEWKMYLKDFPEGECVEEAEAFLAEEPLRREKAACETAQKRSNEKEWKQYLKDFPEGECVEEAKTFLAEEPLRKEKAACEKARNDNSSQGWEKYLEKYPNGKCAAQARDYIDNSQNQENAEIPDMNQGTYMKIAGATLLTLGAAGLISGIVAGVIYGKKAKNSDSDDEKCETVYVEDENGHIGAKQKCGGSSGNYNRKSFLSYVIGGTSGGVMMLTGLPLLIVGIKKESIEISDLSIVPHKDGFYASFGFNF